MEDASGGTPNGDALRLENYLPCPSCYQVLHLDADAFSGFFDGGSPRCSACLKSFDLWRTILEHVRDLAVLGTALCVAGAKELRLKVDLRPNEVRSVNLEEHGLPATAEILRLNLKSGVNYLPVLLHGNEAVVDVLPPRFTLFAKPLDPTEEHPGGPLFLNATWIDSSQDDTSISHLLEAARKFTDHRYKAVVVPAHIAVESALAPVVSEGLRGFCGKEKLDDFLQNGATFSHQVNVLLPMVAHMVQAPPMPDLLRGQLNRLRILRNDVAHSGSCEEISHEQAAELLVAAIFGIRFSEFLHAKIVEAKSEGKLPGPATKVLQGIPPAPGSP